MVDKVFGGMVNVMDESKMYDSKYGVFVFEESTVSTEK